MKYHYFAKGKLETIFLLTALLFTPKTNAQIINTVAGVGTSSFSGDGGLAISAELAQPVSVARDGSGNIYISDQGNHRIRKIAASTGNISTVAGSSTSGFSGDGAAATAAKLNYPVGIAIDGSGNIYIADRGNNRIRKVTLSTGYISTIAGTGTAGFSGDGAAATSAQINNPAGVAVDGSGNVYIADQYNQRIRKIDASTGYISTIAGTGTYGYSGDGAAATSATFQNPTSIKIDGSGNLYIADLFNHAVRKITASTGYISTIAGTGTAGYSGDGAAATSANLNYPTDIAIGDSGNIYIAAQYSHRIRKVSVATGYISTFAGTGTAGYSGDGGLAISANINYPTGLASDAGGNIYIADRENHRIRFICNFNEKPTVSSPVNYCIGVTASALSATGTSLKWFTTPIGGTGSSTAPTPSTASAGTTTYYVASISPYGCEGPRDSIKVVVNSLPAAPTVSTPVTYCVGATASALTATGTSLKWYTSATGGIGTTTAPTPSTTTAGTTYYYVSQSSATTTCESARATIAVVVNDVPSAPTGTSTINYCEGATSTALTATGTSLKWYTTATGGTASSTAPTPSTSSAGTTYYYVSQSNSCGESSRKTITVIVNAKPSSPTVTTPLSYCQYATASALSASGTGLKWYSTATGGGGTTTSPTPSTTTSGTVTYYVSQTNATTGCESDRASIVVNITAAPSAPTVTSPVNLCIGATASALTASGTSLKWYTSSAGGTGSSTAPTPSTSSTGTTYYYVSQTSSSTGCESGRSIITVVVNPLPSTPSVTTPINYCMGKTASALTASGTALLWYTSSTGGTGSSTAPTPSTSSVGTTYYYVSQTTSCGESARATITVNITPVPSAPTVTSPITYCQGDTGVAALTASGSGLKWYTSATGGTGSSTAPKPSTALADTLKYYVSATNAYGCESDRTLLMVIIKAAPLAPIVVTPVHYCVGATATALTATGTGLTWYTTAIGGVGSSTAPTPSTATVGNTVYYVSQTDTAACRSLRAAITVSIHDAPLAPTVTSPINYCKGATTSILSVTTTGDTLKWYNTATGGTASLTAPTPSSSVVGADTFYVSLTSRYGCGEGLRSRIIVITNDKPTPPTVVSPVNYCIGQVASALSAAGTSLKWYSTATGGSGSATAPTPSTSTATTLKYYVSQTNAANCESDRDSISVVINPKPSAPTVTTPVTYCAGATASSLSASGTSLLWYNTATGGIGSSTAPTPVTTSTGTFYYYVSQSNSYGCESPRSTITVNINTGLTAPTVTSPVTYCSGKIASALTATGSSLKWYTSATGGTGVSTAPTPITTTIGSDSFYVSQTSTCGESERALIVVIINPTPSAPIVPSDSVEYCSGKTASVLSASGTNLKWYSTATGGGGVSTAPTPSTTTAGTNIYYVSQTNSYTCESSRSTITVTINPTPAAPTVVTPIEYCSGKTASTLAATGTNLKWYNAASGGIGDTAKPTPSTASTGATSYFVSQTSALGCESNRAEISVIVYATPTAPTVGFLVTLCLGGSSSSLTATGSGLKWYTASIGGTGSTTAPTPSTAFTGTTYYYVSQTSSSGCESPRATILVNIDTLLSAPTVITPVTYCQGDSASALVASGTPLRWYVGSPTATYITTAPTPSTSTSGVFKYYVSRVSIAGCEGNKDSITVTINPLPSAPTVTDSIFYCVGATTYTLSATGTGLKWYSSATGGTGSSTAPTPSSASAGTTIYYVSQTNSYPCEGPRASIVVTVNTLPTAPTVTTPISYCMGATASALSASGSGLKWYTVATGGTGSSTAPTPSTAFTGTTTYYVSQASAASCEGPRAAINVVINPIPATPTITTPVSYCLGATASALSATGTSLKWYTSATGGTGSTATPTPSTATSGVTKYYVTQTSSFTCESARDSITVTINPLPSAPTVTDSIFYCVGATTYTLSATGTGLKWYSSATGGTGSSTAPTPSSASAGTTIYYVSQTNSYPCEGPRASIVVTVNTLPTAPIVTTPITYCEHDSASVLSATGTNLKWYTVATGATGTFTTTAPTPTTSSATTTYYYVSQTNSIGCESSRTEIAVVVNPLPAKPIVISPISYCKNETPSALSATGISIKWYSTATGGTGSSTAPTPSTATVGTINYYVTQTSTLGCESKREILSVTINDDTTKPIVTSPVGYCIGAKATPLKATGTSLTWYTSATGGTGSSIAPTPSTTTVGTTVYYVSQKSITTLCESPRALITVNVSNKPDVSISPIGTPIFVFCKYDTVSLKASSTVSIYSYQWYKDGVLISGATDSIYKAFANGNYKVEVTNLNGCFKDTSVYVYGDTLPDPILSPTSLQFCPNVNIVLFCTPAVSTYKYEWYKDSTLMVGSITDKIIVNIPGTYYILVTDSLGCVRATNHSTATTYPPVPKPIILRTDPILKLSRSYKTYQWYRNSKVLAGANAITYTWSVPGKYWCEVTDGNDCATFSDTVDTEQKTTIGKVNAKLSNIKIYPNPTSSKVFIDADFDVNVVITDITGKLIMKQQKVKEIDLAVYADGIYILNIFDNEGERITVQRIEKLTGR